MQHLIDYAKSFLGVPYIWGGAHPSHGLDCSGLVQLILAAAGLDPVGDQTAQALYNHLEKNGTINAWGAGSIAFFGKDATRITHVGFCIDQYRMIEAAGGDSTCVDVASAIKKEAFVKMTMIKRRGDLVAVIKPNYSKIGLV